MMKHIRQLGLLTIGCAMMAACQKDPYAGKQDEIARAIPPKEKIVGKVLNVEELVIETSVMGKEMAFLEGVESRASFIGHVLKPALKDKGQIVIENINEFPGADYNAETGMFIWQPDKNFLNGEEEVTLVLRIALVTEATDDYPAYFKPEEYKITVSKVLVPPEILSNFTDMESKTITEGESLEMVVQVRDTTASEANKRRPTLTAVQTAGAMDKVPFTFVETKPAVPDPKDPTLWTLTYTIYLQNVFLKESVAFSFELYAISPYKKISDVKKVTTTAIMKLIKPESSFPADVVSVPVGKDFSYSFSVYVPLAKGRLEIPEIHLEAFANQGVASLTCNPGASASTSQCNFMWTPPAVIGDVAEFEAKILAKSVSFGAMKSAELSENISLKFKLVNEVK